MERRSSAGQSRVGVACGAVTSSCGGNSNADTAQKQAEKPDDRLHLAMSLWDG